MAIKNESLTIVYSAWDTVNNVYKNGDVSNHTLQITKDGSVLTSVSNTPSELGSGEYSLVLNSSEMNADFIKIVGTSSTSGVIIIPVYLTTERGLISNINTRTTRVDSLIENSSGDRFTSKALEVVPDSILISSSNKIKTNVSGQVESSNMRGTDNSLLASNYIIPDNTGISDAKVASQSVDNKLTAQRALNLDKLQVGGVLANTDNANSFKADQTVITNHLTDIKGTGFVKDTQSLTNIKLNTGRVDSLIENSNGDRFTSKALEQSPSNGDATSSNQTLIISHLTDVKGTGFIKDTQSLTNIKGDTSRVTGLIENVNGDRYTTKALEQAPSGGGGGGDATSSNQTLIINHLTDVKGTGFIKDTNSLTNLSSGGTTNLSVDATIVEVN